MDHSQALAEIGQKRSLTASAFEQDTLKEGTEVTVWSKQVAQDEALWFGYGFEAREYAEAFIFLELLASGGGSGTEGDALTGELVAAITNSRQDRVIDSVTIDNLGELADAKASERTKRPIMAALAPYAKPGRHLEFRIVADPESDGKEIDPANSAGRLYYGQQS